jgi:hypothetical protein
MTFACGRGGRRLSKQDPAIKRTCQRARSSAGSIDDGAGNAQIGEAVLACMSMNKMIGKDFESGLATVETGVGDAEATARWP